MKALRRQPQRESARLVPLPAPVGGMTSLVPGSAMPPGKCTLGVNLIPGELGLRTRLGGREWVTGLDGPALSSLPFQGSSAGNNRQFYTTATGIWDCSSSTNAPTQVLTFASAAGAAGHGVCHAVVNAAGTHFLLYTDEVNGYHVYSEASSTWTKIAMGGGATQVSGVDPAKFVFVTVWGNRVWFVERDSAAAWYLDVSAIYGAATKFNFGSKFRAGGPLVGLWSWTAGDGGTGGLSDRLVAVSGGGDVVIYEGYDPADASKISISGVWSVGAVPAGRQIATTWGGDLLVLSTLGLIPLSRLTSGTTQADPGQYATADVAHLFAAYANAHRSERGWGLAMHPGDNALVVLIPTGGAAPLQLVMSLATRGWYVYRDLPMSCAAPWDGKMYFGTADGRVLVCDSDVDGVTLADPDSYTPIQFQLLSFFTNFGSPRQKRVHLIRPRFRTGGASPTVRAAARYDWDTSELATVIEARVAGGAGSWGSAVWGTSKWGGDSVPMKRTAGACGIGQFIAIALRGTAQSRVTLISIDVMFDEGGML